MNFSYFFGNFPICNDVTRVEDILQIYAEIINIAFFLRFCLLIFSKDSKNCEKTKTEMRSFNKAQIILVIQATLNICTENFVKKHLLKKRIC